MRNAGAWIAMGLVLFACTSALIENSRAIVITDEQSNLVCVEEDEIGRVDAQNLSDWLHQPLEAGFSDHMRRMSLQGSVWAPLFTSILEDTCSDSPLWAYP